VADPVDQLFEGGLGDALNEIIFGRMTRLWRAALGQISAEELATMKSLGGEMWERLEPQPFVIKLLIAMGLVVFLLERGNRESQSAAPDIDALLKKIFEK
jgi:hypothetical protein